MNEVLAHCGTTRVPEDLVMEVEAPEPTETWNPIPHREIIQSMKELVKTGGLEIDSRSYSMNPKGTRMFGVWTLKEKFGDTDIYKAIGFRNSTDKSMSIGMCAGSKVFVCDNLAFSGEYVSIRKHTSGLNSDSLAFVAVGALMTISKQFDRMAAEADELRREVPYALHLTNELVSNGIVNKRELPDFLSILEDYARGRFYSSFEGAFTELIRERSYLDISERSAVCRKFLLEQVRQS